MNPPGAPRRLTVLVCRGPTCGDQRGGHQLYESLSQALVARGLTAQVTLAGETCFGHCLRGPNILVCNTAEVEAAGGSADLAAPSAVLYNRMTLPELQKVIERHLAGGMVVRPFLNRLPVKPG